MTDPGWGQVIVRAQRSERRGFDIQDGIIVRELAVSQVSVSQSPSHEV